MMHMNARRHSLAVLAAALCLLGFGARSAFAHRLKVFAMAEGEEIQGYVYFPGGGRAADVPLQVLGPNGRELGEVRTDADGQFAFVARLRCDHRFVADSGDGHRASFTVGADELPADLPAPQGAPISRAETADEQTAALERAVERAVSRQVRPLREQLEAMETRTRWHDVLGGIGYILGVTGVAFYLLGRRRGAGTGAGD